MREVFAFGVDDFGHTGYLCGLLGGFAGVVPGYQHVHVATALRCGRHGVEGGALDRRVVVFCNYEGCHVQITLASFLSLATSVATSGTLMPALRFGGSVTFKVLRWFLISTPRSAGLKLSICFFLAFMMFGKVT